MKRLGELLVEKGLITEEQLQEVLAKQKESGDFLGEIIVELGFIQEDKLVSIISEQLSIASFLGVKDLEIEDFLLDKVPYSLAKKELILPIDFLGNTLTIVMANPMARNVIEDLRMLTSNEIDVMIGAPSELKAAITRLYKQQKIDEEGSLTKMFEEETMVDADVVEEEQDHTSADELMKMTEDKDNENFIKLIIINALKTRSSDIHIEPLDDKTFRLRYRIDSVLYEQKTYPIALLRPIIAIIKLKSKCKIDESRKPQDGRFQYVFNNRKIDFRTSFIPTVHGERAEIRIGDKEAIELELDKLGFNDRDLKVLKDSLARPWGMILVAGPTGSGKTTTLYSMVNEIFEDDSNIMTVEQPIEFDLPGVNQVNVQIDEEAVANLPPAEREKALEGYMTFPKALKAFLRQDPDKIMVGEIRDELTADIAIRAALTGHMVVSSLHTNDAPSVITRLMNIGAPNFLVAASLICIVAQKLVRKICPKCKTEIIYDAEELVKMNVEPKEIEHVKVFYKGKGCSYCANTGYYKRTAIFEVFPLTEPVQDLIMARGSIKQLRDLAISEGMLTLRQQAILKVELGETTLEEMASETYGG